MSQLDINPLRLGVSNMPCPRQRERPPNLRFIQKSIQFLWVSTVANQLRQFPQIPGISGDSVPEATGRNWRPFEPKQSLAQTKQLGMSSSGWQLGVFCITLLKSVFFSSVSLKKSYHLSISISMHCPHESIHLLKLKQKTTTTEDSSILRFVHWIFHDLSRNCPPKLLPRSLRIAEPWQVWKKHGVGVTQNVFLPCSCGKWFFVEDVTFIWKKVSPFQCRMPSDRFFLQVMFNQIILQIQASEASPREFGGQEVMRTWFCQTVVTEPNRKLCHSCSQKKKRRKNWWS